MKFVERCESWIGPALRIMGCSSSRQRGNKDGISSHEEHQGLAPTALSKILKRRKMSLNATTYDPATAGESNSKKPHPNAAEVSLPTYAQYDSTHTQIAAGVVIFHVASARAVVCYHTRDHYYFLPKGRKDAGETVERAACREGFEESGYRCRLLPLPQSHRQPAPAETWGEEISELSKRWSTEPMWTQLAPNRRQTQYILFWYVAETLPPDLQRKVDEATEAAKKARSSASTANGTIVGSSAQMIAPYIEPAPFPPSLTLTERIKQDKDGYMPLRQPNTGVDEEEANYDAMLLPIDEAVEKLTATSGVMADLVRKGWSGIQGRLALEDQVRRFENLYDD